MDGEKAVTEVGGGQRHVADRKRLLGEEVVATGEIDEDGGVGVGGGELICAKEGVSEVGEGVGEGSVLLRVGAGVRDV